MSRAKAQRDVGLREQTCTQHLLFLGGFGRSDTKEDCKKGGTEMTENELAAIVVDTSVRIHRQLGPGLLERAYESVLAYELGRQGLSIERQVPLPLIWDGMVVLA